MDGHSGVFGDYIMNPITTSALNVYVPSYGLIFKVKPVWKLRWGMTLPVIFNYPCKAAASQIKKVEPLQKNLA